MPLGPGDERIVRPDAVVFLGAGGSHPAFTVVQRLRLSPETVEPSIAALRELLRAKGRRAATFEVGPSATPPDLVTRLRALGMVPFEEPFATGMVATRPPPQGTSDLVATRADTVEDCVAGFEVLATVFGEREETPAARRERAEARLAADRAGHGGLFVARLGDRVVAAATSNYTSEAVILGGAATLPEARGRGAYTALVAARFADAVRVGRPTLVIQAGAMSRPILERMGFETVCRVEILLDPTLSVMPPNATTRGP
jgi:hypothetical protein